MFRQILAAGADPDMPDGDGNTLLHAAVESGRAEVLQVLLDAGAEPNVPDQYGNAPLRYAAVKEYGDVEVLRVLLDGGADPDMPHKGGNTALLCAVRTRWVEAVALLLRHDVCVYIEDDDGNSPLAEARARDFYDIIDLLEETVGAAVEPAVGTD